jgi:hypothetical protein
MAPLHLSILTGALQWTQSGTFGLSQGRDPVGDIPPTRQFFRLNPTRIIAKQIAVTILRKL